MFVFVFSVESATSGRKVGSIADYDPMNDRYGSIAGQGEHGWRMNVYSLFSGCQDVEWYFGPKTGSMHTGKIFHPTSLLCVAFCSSIVLCILKIYVHWIFVSVIFNSYSVCEVFLNDIS